MKLITVSTEIDCLHRLKDLLQENGIPAIVYLMFRPSLWIYIDKQLNEALTLANNNKYTVINKVDVAMFYESYKNLRSE